jgi:hypothetical protein
MKALKARNRTAQGASPGKAHEEKRKALQGRNRIPVSPLQGFFIIVTH